MEAIGVTVGEGGKTNSVCEGNAEMGGYFDGDVLVGNAMLLRLSCSLSGGGTCFRDRCFRRRGDGLLSCTATGVTGEGGTGGSAPSEGARRLPFPGAILKCRPAGTRDTLKESLETGAESGGEEFVHGRGTRASREGVLRVLVSPGEPGDSLDKEGLRRGSRASSKAPPMPNNSGSSSASTRSSLKTLPVVRMLAMEPVRFRPYLLLHAEPMPALELREEMEGLRAMARCSISRSRALASCCTASLSLSS